MRFSLLTAILLCVIVGALGGALRMMLVPASLVTSVLLGGLYGLLFALLCAPRAVTPGAGLIWGLGHAFVLWLAIPAGILPVMMGDLSAIGMLDTGRAHFSDLVTYVLCFGTPLGVALGTWGGLSKIPEAEQQERPQPDQTRFSLPRALVVGKTGVLQVRVLASPGDFLGSLQHLIDLVEVQVTEQGGEHPALG